MSAEQQQYQEQEEIEVEVEVTDDEVEEEEAEEIEEEEATEEEPAPLPSQPVTPSKKPGKVTPSKAVSNLKHQSPENVAKVAGPSLSVGKNPFPTFGDWTQKTLGEIEILVPVLTSKDETTNELTRSTRPEVRYWKAPIIFKHGNFTSDTLRFNNVPIPFHTGKNYGSGFVYLCLPGFAGTMFAEAGKTRRPTRAHERTLVLDPNRWWKVANKVEDCFGVINKATKKFHTKSLDTIFDATHSGITASVVLKFFFKASTEGMEALKPTTPGTISVELVRGFIAQTDINVEMPTKVFRGKAKADPAATSKDVATDDLMKRLQELGL